MVNKLKSFSQNFSSTSCASTQKQAKTLTFIKKKLCWKTLILLLNSLTSKAIYKLKVTWWIDFTILKCEHFNSWRRKSMRLLRFWLSSPRVPCDNLPLSAVTAWDSAMISVREPMDHLRYERCDNWWATRTCYPLKWSCAARRCTLWLNRWHCGENGILMMNHMLRKFFWFYHYTYPSLPLSSIAVE